MALKIDFIIYDDSWNEKMNIDYDSVPKQISQNKLDWIVSENYLNVYAGNQMICGTFNKELASWQHSQSWAAFEAIVDLVLLAMLIPMNDVSDVDCLSHPSKRGWISVANLDGAQHAQEFHHMFREICYASV